MRLVPVALYPLEDVATYLSRTRSRSSRPDTSVDVDKISIFDIYRPAVYVVDFEFSITHRSKLWEMVKFTEHRVEWYYAVYT